MRDLIDIIADIIGFLFGILVVPVGSVIFGGYLIVQNPCPIVIVGGIAAGILGIAGGMGYLEWKRTNY